MVSGNTSRSWSLAILSLVLALFSGLAAAATLKIAANGEDSASCGSSSDPCRSISRGIDNAQPGDTIIVGPGRYGDLDGDGAFGRPGEEAAQIGYGCQCVIDVDKSVRIRSAQGAAVTFIDASSFEPPAVGIVIEASNVELGRPSEGFTVQGSSRFDGIAVFGAATNRVRVAGNIVTGAATGISVFGNGNTVEHNLMFGSSFGIETHGSNHTIRNNSVIGAGIGFLLTGSPQNVTNNVASANDTGFWIEGTAITLTKNTTTGNRSAGVRLVPGARASLSQNNIMGNGTTADMNCGVLNQSGTDITATKNYWGVGTGPGSDPADRVCNEGSSTTATSPSAQFLIAVPTDEQLNPF